MIMPNRQCLMFLGILRRDFAMLGICSPALEDHPEGPRHPSSLQHG